MGTYIDNTKNPISLGSKELPEATNLSTNKRVMFRKKILSKTNEIVDMSDKSREFTLSLKSMLGHWRSKSLKVESNLAKPTLSNTKRFSLTKPSISLINMKKQSVASDIIMDCEQYKTACVNEIELHNSIKSMQNNLVSEEDEDGSDTSLDDIPDNTDNENERIMGNCCNEDECTMEEGDDDYDDEDDDMVVINNGCYRIARCTRNFAFCAHFEAPRNLNKYLFYTR